MEISHQSTFSLNSLSGNLQGYNVHFNVVFKTSNVWRYKHLLYFQTSPSTQTSNTRTLIQLT